MRRYFETGNCGLDEQPPATCPNPTFLQPRSGKWFVHYSACPFDGYLPLPDKRALDGGEEKNSGNLLRYCRGELKQLLVAFRKRMDKIQFHFHPVDALALCYDDSPIKFDLIDASKLADKFIGLANLLNGGARKLRSDQSVLLTGSWQWRQSASDVAQFLHKILCCPLSLVPTIYGLRLMTDNVELGLEGSSRLRWKKSPPRFDGVALVFSAALKESLDRLRAECFGLTRTPASATASSGGTTADPAVFYTPLTFRYVLNDLVQRGASAELMATSFDGLAPAFRQSIATSRAWMERRPVWRVDVVVPFTDDEHNWFGTLSLVGPPLLRLVLVPNGDYISAAAKGPSFKKFLKLNSAKNHLVDNIDLLFRVNSDDRIDRAEISFLLEDRGLLDTHAGLVFDHGNSVAVFFIGPFPSRQFGAEPFDQPYPWPLPTKKSLPSAGSSQDRRLIAESCQESEASYKILFKVQTDGAPLKGIFFKKLHFYFFSN